MSHSSFLLDPDYLSVSVQKCCLSNGCLVSYIRMYRNLCKEFPTGHHLLPDFCYYWKCLRENLVHTSFCTCASWTDSSSQRDVNPHYHDKGQTQRRQMEVQKAQLRISDSCKARITASMFQGTWRKAEHCRELKWYRLMRRDLCFGRRRPRAYKTSQDKARWVTQKTSSISENHPLSFLRKGWSTVLQEKQKIKDKKHSCLALTVTYWYSVYAKSC